MGRLSDILIASDLSPRCDRALERACDLADSWGAMLHVLTVIEAENREPSWRDDMARGRARAEADVTDAVADRPIRWQLHLDSGRPEDAILKLAGQLGCQLVLAGVARNEMLGRQHPGRTVETLMRKCPSPLLVVKQRARRAYQTMFVPTDYSAASELAVVKALDLFPQAEFTLLHAYRVPFASFLSIEANAPEMLENEQHKELEFIGRLEARTGRTGTFKRLVEYGDVDQLIVDFERTQQPDCMVVGAHAHGGAHGWLIPDVAGRLLMSVDCDVLIVPELIGAITPPEFSKTNRTSERE